MTSINRQPVSADAHTALLECRSALTTARASALQAETDLVGARARRANELAEKIADAIAHCERLAFFVLGDLRAGLSGAARPLKPLDG